MPGSVIPCIRRAATALLLSIAVLAPLPAAAQDTLDSLNPGVGHSTVPYNWPLIPQGLGARDQFRLLALTVGTTNAESQDIDSYNTAIQNHIALRGHSAIQPYSGGFKIVGSTKDITARENTGTRFNSNVHGVPIYYLNGEKVADDYDDFYDGSWDTRAGKNVAGDSVDIDVGAWTGSMPDGTQPKVFFPEPVIIFVLGGSQVSNQFLGRAAYGSPRWGLSSLQPANEVGEAPSGTTALITKFARAFVLSEIFTVKPKPPQPVVTLELGSSTIRENGGATFVTATLSRATSEDTTVTVTAEPGAGTTTSDFYLRNTTLTFAAGETTSTGTVRIGASNSGNDNVYAPGRTVTVSGSATGEEDIAVTSQTLTITDDETLPTVTLHLSPSSITENGGVSSMTATLSHPSNKPTTLTVSKIEINQVVAFPVDFDLSTNITLTIAAGATSSSGTVTVTAVDNDIDEHDKSISISASVASEYGIIDPASQTLTITDDDGSPTIMLVLTPASISENGGMSTVSAVLNRPSGVETTITVSAAPGVNAVSGDFTLSANTTLTIAAGATQSTGTVTLTGVDNDVDSPDRYVSVNAGEFYNSNGVFPPAGTSVIRIDDDDAPTAMLIVKPDTISENGGVSTVTAEFSHPSSAQTLVSVSAIAGVDAVDSDFELSDNTTLVIEAGETTSSRTVTITAVDNDVRALDKKVTVTGIASNSQGTVILTDTELTIEDHDDASIVTLTLNPDTISENGGVSTLTATLDHPSSVATTLTMTATAVSPAVDSDITLSANTTLTIAASETTSTGTVKLTGVNNDVDAPDKEVTVSASASGHQDITSPDDQTLTITDDDAPPTMVLHLTPALIRESGGITTVSTVTATLNHPSSAPTTITVSVAALSPAVAADFELSANTNLAIAGGDTSSTGTVTITALDNDTDEPDKTVSVTGTVSNDQGIAGDPSGIELTIEDDEVAPAARLHLSPASIDEDSGATTVTARLSHPSSEATTLAVSATPGANAVSRDFTLNTNTTLTITAGDTQSAGTVTINAVDNSADEPNKNVAVSASASNTQGVNGPSSATLIITDDEGEPTVRLILTPDSISENGGSSTVTAELSHASSAATTVTVSAAAGANAVATDFWLSDDVTLTIAAGETSSTGMVTITAFADDEDGPEKTVTVSASAVNSNGVNSPADLALTIEDENAPPTVTLILAQPTVDENGGVRAEKATFGHPSSALTTIIVSATAGANTGPRDFALSACTTPAIAAGATRSAGTVTITALGNDQNEPEDKTVTATSHFRTGGESPQNSIELQAAVGW